MISETGDITAEWLTAVLRRSGCLPRGAVLAIERTANPAFNSFTGHLVVTYSAGAPPGVPTRLLLKRSRPEGWAVAAGAAEAAFYAQAAARRADLPMIVPCYAAEIDAASGASFILLDDLSVTHRVAMTRDQQLQAGRNVPPAAVCAAVVETLARFHAAWWGPARLGDGVARVGAWHADRAGWVETMDRRRQAWAALIAAEAGWFPDDLRRLVDHLLAQVNGIWEHHLARRVTRLDHLTLTHGDAYFANVLHPNEPGGQVYLIDWQSPEAYLGASDLVNLMATFWTPAQRAEQEREVGALRRYLATLVAAGVTGYSWADLLHDYRLALVEWLLQTLQDRADGAGRDYWWPKMQCLAAAYRDYRCTDLFAGG
jgi:hypothetical protein